MHIEINNCSSPGAHFSDNTNEVLLKLDDWITEHNEPCLKFIEFRKKTSKDKKFNDNNARNIYPLLKNCGFITYQKGDDIDTKTFFTNRGKAYIKALETKKMISESNYSQSKKNIVNQKIDNILEDLIFEAVVKLIDNAELNYTESLKWFLMYLIEFDKIDKNEFAYMVFIMQNNVGTKNWKTQIKEIVTSYRKGEIEINVKVRVRNDDKIKIKSGQSTRVEGISYFTAFSFYSGLVQQAGIIRKENRYFNLIDTKIDKVRAIVEGEDE